MSLHPSLRIDTAGAQQKTVLTRIERIKDLMKKGAWVDGQDVLGLPKTKIVKIKASKKKKEEKAEGAEAGAGTEAAAAPAAAAKPKAGEKPAK
jgi:small basic protein (TIGR04137 family)